ncbi:MAG: hypothetical protein R2809_01930 [Flavobacteriales bacterium]
MNLTNATPSPEATTTAPVGAGQEYGITSCSSNKRCAYHFYLWLVMLC